MKEVKGIKLTHIETVFLANALAALMLHGQELRSRNIIVNLLNAKIREWETARMDLIRKYGEMKGDEPIVDNGRFVINKKNQAKFNKEFEELAGINHIFDVLPSNEGDWKIARGLLSKAEEKGLNYADGEVLIGIAAKLDI